jgi:integrase/recombinase XerD
MTSHPSHRPVSALRAGMIEDMRVRGFTEKTRSDYVRNVRGFAAFIGRSPDTATAEDLRRFQLHQTQTGMQPPSINSAVAALRFFFTVTLDRALSSLGFGHQEGLHPGQRSPGYENVIPARFPATVV